MIEDNILDGVPKRDWVKTVKNTISKKFSNGIPIKGRLIKVNAITRDEFTKSKYSQYQKKYNKNFYKDKFKSANNLDEIIIASTNYVNEDLKHQRKDNFKEFARGNVLVKVENNDYLAKVIVEITASKSMVLYDVIDFTSTKFNIKKESTPYGQHKESIRSGMLSKKVDTHIAQQQNKNAESNGTSVSTSNNIPHKSDNVNNNYMQENENNTSGTLRNLANIMASHEQLLIDALNLDEVRVRRYCRTVDTRFLEQVNRRKPKTMSQLADVWYRSHDENYGRNHHYNGSRYHMLNLHATFTKGTVEFRLFQFDKPSNGKQNGLHAGQLKSYIQLCLALSQMAKEVRTASPKPQQSENPKYAMRTWLLRLGFIGDEFKTARELLTKRLSGDGAFRNGRAA